MKNINLKKVATMLKAEYSKDTEVNLAERPQGDGVFGIVELLQLEEKLQDAIRSTQKHLKTSYVESDLKRALKKYDKTEDTRSFLEVFESVTAQADMLRSLTAKLKA